MNPYEKWLGIYSDGANPTYFELLGVSRDEYDHEIITESAKLQIGKLQKHRNGHNAAACRKLIQRIKRAHQTLTDSAARSKYELKLDQKAASNPSPAANPIQVDPAVRIVQPTVVAQPNKPRRIAAPKANHSSTFPVLPIVAAIVGFLVVGVSACIFYFLFFANGNREVAVVDTEKPTEVAVTPQISNNEKPSEKTETSSGNSTKETESNVVETSTWRKTLKQVAADLEKVPERDQEFVRYFSFDNLVSQTDKQGLDAKKIALSKLINSLSWNAKIAKLEPIGKENSLLRTDIRDLNWETSKWDTVLLDYPYGFIDNTEAGTTIRDSTFCECAVVRGDWFIAAASRPPLYHDLLEVPTKISELEQRLQVDSAANIRNGRVRRVGIKTSSVASADRIIEKHDSAFGSYWITYDFVKDKDLFKTPLKLKEIFNFQHQTQQIIFTLPNGLLGFAQSDAPGQRMNKSVSEIVTDKKMLDHAALTGVSCFDCHSRGLIPASDEVRQHFATHEDAETREAVNDIYVEANEDIFKEPNSRYQQVIADHGLSSALIKGEPIRVTAEDYAREVSLQLAAAEFGVPPLKLRRTLDELRFDEVTPGLEVFTRTSKLDRFTFSLNYQSLAEKLKLGKPLPASLSTKAKRRLATRIAAHNKSQTPNFDRRKIQASDLLREGRSLRSAGKIDEAIEKLESALEIAPDRDSSIRILRVLAELHEEEKNFEGLAKAFSRLLLNLETRNQMQQGHNQFYKAVFRTIVSDEEPHSYLRTQVENILNEPDDNRYIVWPELKPPMATIRPMGEIFTTQLEQSPEHLGTLMVLDTYFKLFRKDPIAHRDVLEKLGESDPKNAPPASTKMAKVLTESGDYEKAARMYEQLNRANDNPSSFDYYREGMAWTNAKRKEKAIPVLEKAEKLLTRENPSSIFLVKIGEAWTQFEEHRRAVKTYTHLLGQKGTTLPLKKIQKNLKQAMATSGMSANEIESNKLLDPKRRFRETAERFDSLEESIVSIRNSNYLLAAKNWLKGDRPKKALASATKAWEGIQQNRKNRNMTRECTDLAKIFLELDQKQLAYDAYVVALKHAKYSSSIANLQKTVAKLETDPAVRKSGDSKDMLDDKFKFRSAAKKAESKQANTEAVRVQNLFDAAGSWAKAGESSDVLRCAKEGVEILDRLAVPGSDGKTTEEVARLYHAVIKLQSVIEKQLASANGKLGSDVQTYSKNELAQLVKVAETKLAGLDEATKRRVDPMNKFRDDARRLESEAKRFRDQKHFGESLRLYKFAAQTWERTGNKEEQREAIKKSREVLDQMGKDAPAFSIECSLLGAQLLKIGETKLARKYYNLAMETDPVPRQKEKYRKIIEDIDAKSKL